MDRPLTPYELDVTIRDSLLGSAPGHDNMLNEFLHRLGPVARGTLRNMIHNSFANGSLPEDSMSGSDDGDSSSPFQADISWLPFSSVVKKSDGEDSLRPSLKVLHMTVEAIFMERNNTKKQQQCFPLFFLSVSLSPYICIVCVCGLASFIWLALSLLLRMSLTCDIIICIYMHIFFFMSVNKCSRNKVWHMTIRLSVVGEWTSDSSIQKCEICEVKFNFGRRRHHCRYCGGIFCASCSSFFVKLQKLHVNKRRRVCRKCFEFL
ncbi:hypothetical protein TcCL_ESM01111 [Trypanosoma cruzi]|nr:hypothetical protein TcCL_ESM01111 [Trypanosoma cruzi]